MSLTSFSISRVPRIEYGRGSFAKIPLIMKLYGTKVLLVTGSRSLQQQSQWQWLMDALRVDGFEWQQVVISGEPSPQCIDEVVAEYHPQQIEVVLGIGGGSVLDAAKAIAGLLKPGNSVMDHLEGVGPEKIYRGPSTPFIAVPTTAGTGSEATKNAVLSMQGAEGFKKSFRDDQLVAEYAILDPLLLNGCSAELIAGNGMDALTQLLESYLSTKANPFTDALALSGLRRVRDSLLDWYQKGDQATEAQDNMLYAAWLSGVTLAQVGLGSVHGLASPLGAFFPIPHGIACGTLVAEASKVNIVAMQSRDPQNPGLKRYAEVGRLFSRKHHQSDEEAQQMLTAQLSEWTAHLQLPGLSHYGVTPSMLTKVVENCRGSSMKTNPIVLFDEEVMSLLSARL
ncbi:MAG: iron-containing alcohol dehydrogenase [Gammaproteobacteria bacterium]|nr:iron-containing alcohol dehydrogenase [Gammaproteobacteria bacterium]MCF6230826.1 iron-containing alcohol dehydrogenase [Gammaproteobacteria bacterium]